MSLGLDTGRGGPTTTLGGVARGELALSARLSSVGLSVYLSA